jgi:hypothetical protein
LADIAVLRAEPGLFGWVVSDPTVSRRAGRQQGYAGSDAHAVPFRVASISDQAMWLTPLSSIVSSPSFSGSLGGTSPANGPLVRSTVLQEP